MEKPIIKKEILWADALKLYKLLGKLFDTYENGDPCYENGDSLDVYLGNAVRLDDETFHEIVDILNKYDPNNERRKE